MWGSAKATDITCCRPSFFFVLLPYLPPHWPYTSTDFLFFMCFVFARETTAVIFFVLFCPCNSSYRFFVLFCPCNRYLLLFSTYMFSLQPFLSDVLASNSSEHQSLVLLCFLLSSFFCFLSSFFYGLACSVVLLYPVR